MADASHVIIQVATPAEFELFLPGLRRLLQSCVNPDPTSSSIGFRAPLSDADATEYWTSLWTNSLAASPRPGAPVLLFVVTPAGSATHQVLGSVQLACNPKQTHSHKAEVVKLLVHPDARGQGMATKLMNNLEHVALGLGRTMLVLDTATKTPARQFYLNAGWREWGICPDYATSAVGNLEDCSFFCKFLHS
ncbi:Acetyltransferase [Paramyrothecium foliicola]|nr:Acetyltransferase [Paramyrothecium foliicola]